ncbi:MAG: GNAT family N-acetyltransferase, partial [Pseudomonadota bacterium]
MEARAKLKVRVAARADVDGIVALSSRVYPEEPPYTRGMISGQINAFPEGNFVAIYEGEVVGYAASTILREAVVMAPHTWQSVSGAGYGGQHNARGDWLYGLEVMVDPARRRLRLGARLYQARERLCADLGLKGIAFGARLANFRKQRARYATPDAYLAAVMAGDVKDPVLAFQMRQG